MNRPLILILCAWHFIYVWGWQTTVQAQASAASTTAPAASAPALPTVEALQNRLKEIAADASLDDLAKQSLTKRYQEVIDSLTAANKYKDLTRDFARALQDGPGVLEKTQKEIADLEKQDPGNGVLKGLGKNPSTSELETALATEQAALATLKSQLTALKDEALAAAQRPGKIGERRVAAETELSGVRQELEALPVGEEETPAEAAERMRLRALEDKLAAEIAMLAEEDRTKEVRATSREATRNLTEAKITAAEKRVAALQQLSSTLLSDQLERARSLMATVREKIPEPAPATDEVLKDLAGLIDETQTVRRGIVQAEERVSARENELSRITEAYNMVEHRVKYGKLDGSLTQELRAQLRTLPSERDIQQRLAETTMLLSEARNGLFELELAIRENGQAGATGVEDLPPPAAPGANGAAQAVEEAPKLSEKEWKDLKEARDALRKDLGAGYRRWIRDLENLDGLQRDISHESGEFRAYAKEKLVLMRTSPVIGLETFRSLPEGLLYCYGPSRLAELSRQFQSIPTSLWLGPGLMVILLLLLRPLLVRVLKQTGAGTLRISTDRYGHTVMALAVTVLLAVPPTLAFLFLGLALVRQPEASEWSYGLGEGLVSLSFFIFEVGFLIALCRRGGLGAAHFKWDPMVLRRIRRLTYWLILAVVPAQLTVYLVMAQPGIPHLNGVGRIAGLVMVIGLGWVMALILHPEKGIAAATYRISPTYLFGRLRKVWFALPLIVTLLLVVLLVSGYLYAGLMMTDQIVKSLTAVGAAFVIHGMILRWFAMRERRLALREKLKERQARLESARAARAAQAAGTASPEAPEGPSSADEAPIPEVDEEEEMDLTTVGEQTRRLLGFVVGLGLLWRLLSIWAEFDPIVNVLDGYRTVGGLSLADIGVTVLVVAATIATTRNLPGLLEMLVLRRLGLDPGTRAAMTTLAKYVVIGMGAMFLFKNLGVDWSQFGWIAAALGVGLGFGLQEVVANFVCGIILLFERPVRVGDVVTVDGIDGVVSRLQIRATTITDWDRKEFIVPNKQFVTGTVLNWTLTNTMNRIVIVVGTAYGSDTKEALHILEDVARQHPLVLEDPEPVSSFEEFGDSSLKLVLRCFLPTMDYRLRTISELHAEIDRRFKEADIEIPFPQRDLHLRTVGPDIQELARRSRGRSREEDGNGHVGTRGQGAGERSAAGRS